MIDGMFTEACYLKANSSSPCTSRRKFFVIYDNMDVVQRINIQGLRWLSLVVRMEEDAPAR